MKKLANYLSLKRTNYLKEKTIQLTYRKFSTNKDNI